MRVLADTHALLWFAEGDPRLSATARGILNDADTNSLFVSIASFWEISLKVGLGKLAVQPSYDEFLDRLINESNFLVLPINIHHTKVIPSLPFHHRDPFDRMLIAQAIAEDLPIVGADIAFDAYPIRRLW